MREGRIAMNVLDWSVPYLKYFEEMTRIPHGSFHEKAYSDYLAAWADFGAADNVIPSYGAVRFTTDQPAREVAAQVEQWDAVFRKELEFSDPGLQITLSPAQADRVFSARDSRDVIGFVRFLPNGMRSRSMRFENLPVASSNLGTLRVEGDALVATNCHRGAMVSYLEDMEQVQEMLCSVYQIQRTVTGYVAPFDYIEHSPIRAAPAQTFHEVTGRELQPVFVHGGIEAGYFKEMYPEMDIVTIGPLVLDEHMVTERLDLKSFDEIWTVLVKLLASL